MTPGPGLRKCTAYLSPGPGGMPLALRLSDWLGHKPCLWFCGCLEHAAQPAPNVCECLDLLARASHSAGLALALCDCGSVDCVRERGGDAWFTGRQARSGSILKLLQTLPATWKGCGLLIFGLLVFHPVASTGPQLAYSVFLYGAGDRSMVEVCGLTFELSGRQRHGALDSKRKMGRRPSA